MLHQPGYKVERRLPVLHAIVEPWISPPQRSDLVVSKLVRLEDRLDDVRDTHILEDPAICGAAEEPEAWHDLGAPHPEAAHIDQRPTELPHQPVYRPMLCADLIAQPYCHRLAEQRTNLGVRKTGRDLDVEDEAARNLVAPIDFSQQNTVFAERGIDRQQAVLLDIFGFVG